MNKDGDQRENRTGLVKPRKRGGRLMRMKGLVRKEFLQIVRDPSSIAIAFVLPAVLLIIHGYGVSLDAKNVPVAATADKFDPAVESVIAAFEGSEYFDVKRFRSMPEAVEALRKHKVQGIIRFQSDFTQKLKDSGYAPIQIILNGVDANTARMVSGYSEGVWVNWMAEYARQNGESFRQPVDLVFRVWFNSEMRSRNFLVPGLIAVNMTLIGALLTAMVMAREWERGTMEALMVTPVTMGEILVGKLIPYFIMGMGGMALSVAMAIWIFEVPLRGSFLVLAGSSAMFLLVALGMGLLISIVAKNQFVAGQVAIIVTFLPAFLLSGYVFDIRSMPEPVQIITHIVAARYFISILQSSFLAGDIPAVVLPNIMALFIMALLFLGLCFIKSRKRLD
jgi:ABC-2 type transport system permease protein